MRRAPVIALLLFTAAPAHADAIIVMIAATPTGDGVLAVPVGGNAAFAVAAINVGSSTFDGFYAVPTGSVTVTACRTNPTTGQCLGQASLGTFARLAPGEIQTFSVFVHATGPVLLNPGTARIVAFSSLSSS